MYVHVSVAAALPPALEPVRVTADKYGGTAKANGGPFSVRSFLADLPQTLIVYGTADEPAANREAAEALQRAVREDWSNFTVPVKSDADVTDVVAWLAAKRLPLTAQAHPGVLNSRRGSQ